MLALLQANFSVHLHRANEFEYQPSLFQPVGGMDQLAKALTARVKDRITFGCEVKEIRKQPKERIAAHLATSPGNVLQLLVTCRRRAQEIFRSLAGRSE